MVTFAPLGGDRVAATFRFPGTIWTDKVYLALDVFEPSMLPMVYNADNDEWQLTVILQANATHQFGYVLDGFELCLDRQEVLTVPDATAEEGLSIANPAAVAA